MSEKIGGGLTHCTLNHGSV